MKSVRHPASLFILALPLTAFAHTGIDVTSGFLAGFSHPLGGADHLLAMVAIGLWAAQMSGRALWAVPAAFVSVMLAGGALGMSGIALPFVEQGILLSVLVLGMSIAAALRVPASTGAVLAGIFAVFHGHAHGAEMSTGIGAVSYSVGFALATALLHGAGIAFGAAVRRLDIARLSRMAGAAITLSGIYLAVR